MTTFLISFSLLLAWIVAGRRYSSAGAYDRHGIFSLVICLPCFIVCLACAVLGNIVFGWPSRD